MLLQSEFNTMTNSRRTDPKIIAYFITLCQAENQGIKLSAKSSDNSPQVEDK